MNEKIRKGDDYLIGGVLYEVRAKSRYGNKLMSLDCGIAITRTDEEIYAGLATGRIVLGPALAAKRHDFERVSGEEGTILERHRFIYSCLTMQSGQPPYSNSDINSVLQKLREDRPHISVSRATIYRVVAKFNSKTGTIKLPSKMRIDHRAEEIIRQEINNNWLCKDHASRVTIVNNITNEIAYQNMKRPIIGGEPPIEPVSDRTLYRRLNKIDDHIRISCQAGPLSANAKYKPVIRYNKKLKLCEEIEIDHTHVDAWLVDEDTGDVLGRMHITVIICRASRMPLGFALTWEHESIASVLVAMRHAFSNKPPMEELFGGRVKNNWISSGVGAALFCDNTFAQYSDALKVCTKDLGISRLSFLPRRSPYLKGRIEKFLQTINGATFHNVRGTTVHNKNKENTHDKKIEPQSWAFLTEREANVLLHQFFCDVYPLEPHEGLNYYTPTDVWNAGIAAGHATRVFDDLELLKLKTCIVCTVTVTRERVRYDGMSFHSPELGPMLSANGGSIKATARLDPTCVNTLYVEDAAAGRIIKADLQDEQYRDMHVGQVAFCKREAARRKRERENNPNLIEGRHGLRVTMRRTDDEDTKSRSAADRTPTRIVRKPVTPTGLARGEDKVSAPGIGPSSRAAVETGKLAAHLTQQISTAALSPLDGPSPRDAELFQRLHQINTRPVNE